MGSVFSSNPIQPPLDNIEQTTSLNTNSNPQFHKIILVSIHGEGKSCLVSRYIKGIYSSSSIATIGATFQLKVLDINDEQYRLQIWDPCGEERFTSLSSIYYRGARGIIIVSDITNPKLLEQASHWVNEISKYCKEVPIIWTGSKCDLENERKTSLDDIYKFAEDNNLQYIETSAKDNINVDLLFTTLLCKIEGIPTPNQSRIKSARK